jgi:hypothetical protein
MGLIDRLFVSLQGPCNLVFRETVFEYRAAVIDYDRVDLAGGG